MDSEEVYRMVLVAFFKDTAFDRAKTAFQYGNYAALFDCAHELKGSTANAAMTELSQTASALVACLRNKAPDAETVGALFTALERAYTRTRDGVTIALSE